MEMLEEEKTNAKDWAKVYKGVSVMYEGIAKYNNEKVFLSKETLKKAMPELKGRPVIIEHKLGINPDNMEKYAVGYVTKCEYNNESGDFDCDFVIWDDEAKKLLKDGYTLSTSYIGKQFDNGGTFINNEYDREIKDLAFTHLAIVKNPRYEKVKVYQNSIETDEDEFFNDQWVTKIDKEGEPYHFKIEDKEEPKKEEPKKEIKKEIKKETKRHISSYTKYEQEVIQRALYREDPYKYLEEYGDIDVAKKVTPYINKYVDRRNRVKKLAELSDTQMQRVEANYRKGEYLASADTLFFTYLLDADKLFNTWDNKEFTTGSLEDLAKKMGVYDTDLIRRWTKGFTINYPNYVHFSDTLGLCKLNVYPKGKKEEEITNSKSDIIGEKELTMEKIEVEQGFLNTLLEKVAATFDNSKGKKEACNEENDEFEYEGEKYSKKELVNAFKAGKAKKEEKENEEDDKKEDDKKEDLKDVVDEEEDEKENSIEDEVDFYELMQEKMNSAEAGEDDKIKVYTRETALEKGSKIYG